MTARRPVTGGRGWGVVTAAIGLVGAGCTGAAAVPGPAGPSVGISPGAVRAAVPTSDISTGAAPTAGYAPTSLPAAHPAHPAATRLPGTPLQPEELIRIYQGRTPDGLPVDATAYRADPLAGHRYVLMGRCAAADPTVAMTFTVAVRSNADLTDPATRVATVRCDGRPHRFAYRPVRAGQLDLRPAPQRLGVTDYLAVIAVQRPPDTGLAALVPGLPFGQAPALPEPVLDPGELARTEDADQPVLFDAVRGERYAVTAACASADPTTTMQWRIDDISAPLLPGEDPDSSLASAAVPCDAKPHRMVATLTETGPVQLGVDSAAGLGARLGVSVAAAP